MKVKELIELLNKYDKEQDVTILLGYEECITYNDDGYLEMENVLVNKKGYIDTIETISGEVVLRAYDEEIE